MRRNRDLYNFKIQALQEVNEWLGQPEKQTSDSTLMCVICLLLSTVRSLSLSLFSFRDMLFSYCW